MGHQCISAHIHKFVHPGNLVHCMFLGGGREPQNPEETQMVSCTKLHADSNLSSGLNQGPWNCEAATLPTVPPGNKLYIFLFIIRITSVPLPCQKTVPHLHMYFNTTIHIVQPPPPPSKKKLINTKNFMKAQSRTLHVVYCHKHVQVSWCSTLPKRSALTNPFQYY